MIDEATRREIARQLDLLQTSGEERCLLDEHHRALVTLFLSLGYRVVVDHGWSEERAEVAMVVKTPGAQFVDAPGASTFPEVMKKVWNLIQQCETPGGRIERETRRVVTVSGAELESWYANTATG